MASIMTLIEMYWFKGQTEQTIEFSHNSTWRIELIELFGQNLTETVIVIQL